MPTGLLHKRSLYTTCRRAAKSIPTGVLPRHMNVGAVLTQPVFTSVFTGLAKRDSSSFGSVGCDLP